MAGAISHRQWLDPATLVDALRMMRDEPGVTPVAGCTDLYVSLNLGTLTPTTFVNLWRLDELRGIERRAGALRIGALTTYAEIVASRVIKRDLPMLVAAAREIGGLQIQNRGTLGGNVANASPAGDSLPVLAAVDAQVELHSTAGARLVPFTSFYTGYRKSVARLDELIVAFHIPRVSGRQWFRKVGARAAQAISKVVVAGVAGPEPRIAAGSVAPTVIRLTRTEEALAAGKPVEEAQQALYADIAPIDDIRSTAEYRARVAANLIAQFCRETGLRRSPRKR